MSPAVQALAITLAVALFAAATVVAKHRFFPRIPPTSRARTSPSTSR